MLHIAVCDDEKDFAASLTQLLELMCRAGALAADTGGRQAMKSSHWTSRGFVQWELKITLEMFSGANSGWNARNRYHRRTRSYDHSRSKSRHHEGDGQLRYSLLPDTAQGRRPCNTRFHGHTRNKPPRHAHDGQQWNTRQPYRRKSRSAGSVYAARDSRLVHGGRHERRRIQSVD